MDSNFKIFRDIPGTDNQRLMFKMAAKWFADEGRHSKTINFMDLITDLTFNELVAIRDYCFPRNGTNHNLTPQAFSLLDLILKAQDGQINVISMIKEFRSVTGAGLRDSKNAVEMFLSANADKYEQNPPEDSLGGTLKRALETNGESLQTNGKV